MVDSGILSQMTAWQYGSLIVSPGSWEEGEKKLFKDSRVQVHGWVIQWRGPNNQEGTWRHDETQRVPVWVLNNLGGENWEVVTAFKVDNHYEYVLKRPSNKPV